MYLKKVFKKFMLSSHYFLGNPRRKMHKKSKQILRKKSEINNFRKPVRSLKKISLRGSLGQWKKSHKNPRLKIQWVARKNKESLFKIQYVLKKSLVKSVDVKNRSFKKKSKAFYILEKILFKRIFRSMENSS